MMKLKHAMLHLKEVYPIVWTNWPKKYRRYMVRSFLWWSHQSGEWFNQLNLFS